jgi:hypothetical protein
LAPLHDVVQRDDGFWSIAGTTTQMAPSLPGLTLKPSATPPSDVVPAMTSPSEIIPTTDDILGMRWWNAQSRESRRYWMRRAGDTGLAVDAWREYQRTQAGSGPSLTRPARQT